MTALECLGYDAHDALYGSIFRDINVRYPSPMGTDLRAASLKPVQTQSLQGTMFGKKLGISGCAASPLFYGPWLNRCRG